jgi:flagellar hook-basal body complex protein FliE
VLNAIRGFDPTLSGLTPVGQVGRREAADGFKDSLAQTVREIDGLQKEANQAIETMAAGEPKDVHEVMIAMEKAGISLRLMVQVRNKIMTAYEEIMRLQL